MTCGYAVDKAVGNPADAWITTAVLWMTKIIVIALLGRLRRVRLRSRNAFTSETGTEPGGNSGGRGRSRETGTGSGWLAPAVGPPEPVLPGKPASLDR